MVGITGAMTFYGMTAGLALGVFNAALAFTLQVRTHIHTYTLHTHVHTLYIQFIHYFFYDLFNLSYELNFSNLF